MPHDITLISTLTVAFTLAFLFGFITNRLGLSPLVGYLVAGIAIGLFTPGFVADRTPHDSGRVRMDLRRR